MNFICDLPDFGHGHSEILHHGSIESHHGGIESHHGGIESHHAGIESHGHGGEPHIDFGSQGGHGGHEIESHSGFGHGTHDFGKADTHEHKFEGFGGQEFTGGHDFSSFAGQHDEPTQEGPAVSFQQHQAGGNIGAGYGNQGDFGESHSFSGQQERSSHSSSFSSAIGHAKQW